MKSEKEVRTYKEILESRLKYLKEMNRPHSHIEDRLLMVNLILEEEIEKGEKIDE